jgi:hypothetical protein
LVDWWRTCSSNEHLFGWHALPPYYRHVTGGISPPNENPDGHRKKTRWAARWGYCTDNTLMPIADCGVDTLMSWMLHQQTEVDYRRYLV